MKSIETFATRLKIVRLKTEKNQKDFANMVQSTAATISAYENATKNPSLEIVMNIAEKCNISIDWLCGLSEDMEVKPEIKNYKDIAVRILELCGIDISPCKFELKQYEIDITDVFGLIGESEYQYEWALTLPENDKLLRFISTYKELNALYKDSRITQDVINTWLTGALEELKAVPININASTQSE